MLKDRIKVVAKAGPGKVDVFFSNEKDANSLSRYWATVEGGEVRESSGCEYQVLLNYHTGTDAFPHTLNYYPPREVVEAWMALFEEDASC